MAKRKIIAIDGPSGAGKSTTAKALAERLEYIYVDTGAMYRAIGWKAKREMILLTEEALKNLCSITDIRLDRSPTGVGMNVFVDGIDVTEEIRTPEMGMMASAVSAFQCVRERLLELQRGMGRNGGIVMEGRDIGTVVFPDADIKFFLDAKIEERGKRRHLDLKSKGMGDDLVRVTDEIRKRDEADIARTLAPLKKAGDALYIDSSNMTVQEVVETMLKEIKKDED